MIVRGAVIFALYIIVIVFILWCVITAGENDKRAEHSQDIYTADDYFTIDEADVIEEDADGK